MQMQGYLFKAGKRSLSWKRRWMVLDGATMRYYEKEGGKLKGEIDLTSATDLIINSTVAKPPYPHCFRLILPERTVNLCTDTGAGVIVWVKHLRAAMPSTAEATATLTAQRSGQFSISSSATPPTNTSPKNASRRSSLTRRMSQGLSSISNIRRPSSIRRSSFDEVEVPLKVQWRGDLLLSQDGSSPVLESWVLLGNVLSSLNPERSLAFILGPGTECLAVAAACSIRLICPPHGRVTLDTLEPAVRSTLLKAICEAIERATASHLANEAAYETIEAAGDRLPDRVVTDKTLCLNDTSTVRAAMDKKGELGAFEVPPSTTTMAGWLHKTNPSGNKWQRRFFRLESEELTYSKNPTARPVGIIELTGAEVSVDLPATTVNKPDFGLRLQTPDRVFFLGASIAKERNQWEDAISAAIKRSNATSDMKRLLKKKSLTPVEAKELRAAVLLAENSSATTRQAKQHVTKVAGVPVPTVDATLPKKTAALAIAGSAATRKQQQQQQQQVPPPLPPRPAQLIL